MTETRIRGKSASPGLASGPVFVLPVRSATGRAASGDPATEAAALRAAIGSAVGKLESLASSLSGEAADMLGFQVAMLSDDELAQPAFNAIAAGDAADTAWRAAMDREIAGYATADDE